MNEPQPEDEARTGKERLRVRIARHPVFGAVTTLFIILAGLWGSVYANELRSLAFFPFRKQFAGPELFLLFATLATALFFWERWAARTASREAQGRLDQTVTGLTYRLEQLDGALHQLSHERKEADHERKLAEDARRAAEERLETATAELRESLATTEQARKDAELRLMSKTDELQHLVRTVPPSDFLMLFDSIYAQLARVTENTARAARAELDPGRLETLDGSIRTVLGGIGLLARKFDLRSPGASRAVYGINIMLFRAADDGNEAYRSAAARCSQLEPGMKVDAKTLTGVLEYLPSLSARGSNPHQLPPPDEDDLSIDLVLPIPAEQLRRGDTGKSRVLPGAPLAWVERTPKLYPSLKGFFDDLDTRCALSPEVKHQAEQYFRKHEGQIRSFPCIPLVPLTGSAAGGNGDGAPCGVLNIHRNETDLFSDQSLAEQFAILALPFASMLLQLLDVRTALEAVGRNGP